MKQSAKCRMAKRRLDPTMGQRSPDEAAFEPGSERQGCNSDEVQEAGGASVEAEYCMSHSPIVKRFLGF